MATAVVVAADGGSLSTTVADGTVFTLDIPPNALAMDQELSLVPVVEIAGLPFGGGLIAAAELRPAGLWLLEPAVLTIEPPADVPTADEIPFGYLSGGDELFLYPPDPAGSPSSLSVMALAGYGLARGPEADLVAQSARMPANPEAQFLQAIALLTIREARGASADALAPWADEAVRAADRYLAYLRTFEVSDEETGRLRIQLAVAVAQEQTLNDCEFATQMAPKIGMFKKQLLHVRHVSGQAKRRLQAEVDNLLLKTMQAAAECYDDAYSKCVAFHWVGRSLTMLEMDRVLRAIGAEGLADYRLNQLQLWRKCLTFELSFDSTISASAVYPTGSAAVEGHVKSRVLIQPPPSKLTYGLKGAGLLDYVRFEPIVSMRDCRFSDITFEALTPFEVIGSQLVFGDEGRWELDLANLQLDVAFYQTHETATLRCKAPRYAAPLVLPVEYAHHGHFLDLHLDEWREGAYAIRGWEPGDGGGVIARKSYGRSKPLPVGAGTVTEDTKFMLTHKPQE